MTAIEPHAGTAIYSGLCTNRPREVRRSVRFAAKTLRRAAGARRRSPVSCQLYNGAAQARAALAAAYPEPTTGDLAELDQFNTFLDRHDGRCVLIIATCEVTHA